MGGLAFDLVCVALATGAILDAWHRGSIFEGLRHRVAARRDAAYQADPPRRPWLWELLSCAFCASHHVPYLLMLLMAPGWLWGDAWQLLHFGVYSLAATRVAVLLNAHLPDRDDRYEGF